MGRIRDKLKHTMVQNSSSIQPESIRLLLFLAQTLDFNVWTADVTQAYLQSTDSLWPDIRATRRIPEFDREYYQYLQLLKPKYVLCDAGDLKAAKMDKHHQLELGVSPLRSEPALYIKSTNDQLVGDSVSYFADLLQAGNVSFESLCWETHRTFDTGDEEPLPFNFTRFYIDRDSKGGTCQQKNHIYPS